MATNAALIYLYKLLKYKFWIGKVLIEYKLITTFFIFHISISLFLLYLVVQLFKRKLRWQFWFCFSDLGTVLLKNLRKMWSYAIISYLN